MNLIPKEESKMERNVEFAVRALLFYSLEDAEFKYCNLTEVEKLLVSEDDFKDLVDWLKGG